MQFKSTKKDKIELIQRHFTPLIGSEITGYSIAQLWCEENRAWDDWMDLPFRLHFKDTKLSISWRKFDELMIEEGEALPFPTTDLQVRWLLNPIKRINGIIGQKLKRVCLSPGHMNIGSHQCEIWVDLILTTEENQSLVIYNNLDENGLKLSSNENMLEAAVCCPNPF
ncbi:hypothetical protein [Kiloniella sp.]|uniref:hypothetical protein n=1 Tax=Kiloniella sp. TaxID=1938587 RepID=UPI003A953B30